ncbi:LRR-GTPase of the ROCO family [Ectocarpus siliculosus]|uniref:LRR-GTPase of the ROCO family n=1 Tax=Ectocarpus siliculosus TaxID=2880 RepID=D7FUD0_ECTSI|nr:LRR-GTPase of the ROCO family [Ectocarpus siliculosus]|eukprot:CBJ26200.1 LRR-GTPase of the ROCO family [Ectocarpus siliculosus]
MASTDREVLVALLRSTGGNTWRRKDNWDTDTELKTWYRVKVDDQGFVVHLDLTGNNLRGKIPRELGELRALTSLHLWNNTLTGPIPKVLGTLHGLKTLWLNHNHLAGTIPQELGNCVGLTELWLCENSLEGPIPPVLGKLEALEQLMLWGNKLSGYISEALGNLSMLKVLRLDDNRLTGQIPKALGGLSMLEKLRLDNNRLTGRIPEALGDLRMLEELRLDSNRLTGSIPKELGALAALKHVVLRDNQLTALWNHTLNVEDARHEEASHSMQGGSFPRQLCRLLDVLDRAEREVDLNLDDNPWAEPPESIVAKGAKNIRGYFEDLYAEPCRVQRSSVKIILVGQEGAGKTSLRKSMKAKEATPTGEWKEESTVFADVERMELEGSSIRVYDCAGQVAYTGLLQMFLTPRAVCVIVCNAESFGQQRGTCETGGQVKEDCRKLEELRVCDWLRSISRRVPDNDVILVATKCDSVGGNAGEIGKRIELASRMWLASWVRSGMQPVRLEPGVCLTSCCTTNVCEDGERSTRNQAMEGGWTCDWRDGKDDNPSPSLLHRLVNKPDGGGLRGAQMVIPRSWDIALTVLEALERGRDPVEMVVEDLGDADGGDATGTAACKTGLYHGITAEDLRTKWQEAAVGLAGRDITVTNADNALEGALAIREFDGSLVRHETFVFLDVVWLARILKPLLNHKDEETFDGLVNLGDTGDTRVTLEDPSDIASWGRLKNEGVLEPRLARKLWPNGLSEYVIPTIASLGLTFPLENDPAGGLVVLLRLEHDRPELVGKVIDTFCLDQTPALRASWKIFLGVPAGAIEKVLTRCCSLGGVQTFWRSGVLVHGGVGEQDRSGIFAVVLEYSPSDNELTAQIFGDISTPAPWVALSYVVSAVSLMLLDFPGLRSRGSLKCPQHGDAMPLANMVTRTGDKILEGSRCRQCSPDTRGLGAAAIDLVRMVDIRLDRDVIFREVKARFVDLEGQYSFSSSTASSNDEGVLVQKMEEVARTLKDGFDDLKGRLSKVLDSTQESLMRLQTLQAPNYPYPRLVAIEEIASGGTLTRARGMKRVLSKLRGVGTKEMTLHFLCPVDMTKVPCGYDGDGYRFRETRRWVKKLSPVLQVAMVTAKVAIKATSGLDVDLSDFLKDVNDGLVDELVDRMLDEDELRRVVSGEEDVGTDMQKQTRASYEALTELMGKLERRKDARDGDGYVDFRENMQRLSDGRGGEVWVRNENVQKWLDSHSSAAPSR